jgi:hypothetical protein
MGAIEELQRDCAYCRKPIKLKWKNGPMPSEGVCLVVDQVFHDRCCAKFWADYNGKRALPRGPRLEARRCLKDACLVAEAKARLPQR